MQDFTGGVTELYWLEEEEEEEEEDEEKEEEEEEEGAFFELLHKRFQKQSLMMAEYKAGDGSNHAYSITEVRAVQDPNLDEQLQFIRLRNPYGDERLVKWRKGVPEAHMLGLEELEKYNLSNYDTNGEFWMTYNDFFYYFYRVQLCNLDLLSLSSGGHGNWSTLSFEGAWCGDTAAGKDPAAICANPQYKLSLSNPDDGDNCTVIISLIQKFRRNELKMNLNLQFYIYRTDVAVTNSMESYEKYHEKFFRLREIAKKFKLPGGNYTLIPCRYEPGESCKFLLRVFSKSRLNKI